MFSLLAYAEFAAHVSSFVGVVMHFLGCAWENGVMEGRIFGCVCGLLVGFKLLAHASNQIRKSQSVENCTTEL